MRCLPFPFGILGRLAVPHDLARPTAPTWAPRSSFTLATQPDAGRRRQPAELPKVMFVLGKEVVALRAGPPLQREP